QTKARRRFASPVQTKTKTISASSAVAAMAHGRKSLQSLDSKRFPPRQYCTWKTSHCKSTESFSTAHAPDRGTGASSEIVRYQDVPLIIPGADVDGRRQQHRHRGREQPEVDRTVGDYRSDDAGGV